MLFFLKRREGEIEFMISIIYKWQFDIQIFYTAENPSKVVFLVLYLLWENCLQRRWNPNTAVTEVGWGFLSATSQWGLPEQLPMKCKGQVTMLEPREVQVKG